MEHPIEMGGKVEEEDRCVGTSALNFEIMSVAALRAEGICKRAHESLKTKTSIDAGFLTDTEIRQKLELIDREYREGREKLIKLLRIHVAHRGIHWNRIQNEERARNLKEAEAKYL